MNVLLIVSVLLLALAALLLLANPRAAARRLRVSLSVARVLSVELEVDHSADPPP